MRFILSSLLLIGLCFLSGCDNPPETTPCFLHAADFRARCFPKEGEPYYIQIQAMDEFMCLSADDTSNLLRWIERVKK